MKHVGKGVSTRVATVLSRLTCLESLVGLACNEVALLAGIAGPVPSAPC